MKEAMSEREQYVEELLAKLTLEEKIGMIHGAGLFRTAGVERLEIPPIYFSDGPMGVRAEFADNEWRSIGTTDDYVSYLPCGSAVASTWNEELASAAGAVLGAEARGRGKDVILGPGINIKRSPLCGRNFEYMSEDPYLIRKLVVPLIQGIQKNDVSACVKHFAANSQETQRLFVDTIVDERTLREIYFPGFEAAVHEGDAYSVMGAYNLIDGEHCCMSKRLLNGVLREEWKYEGLVVSDWGGVHDTALAAESALDVEMDVTYDFDKHFMADALLEKIKANELSEALVDEKVRNILRLMLRLKMIGPEQSKRSAGAYNTPAHREAAYQVAAESVVLLKNEDNILPLKTPANQSKKQRVAVIGANAAAIHSNGGGSAEIKALYELSPLMGIKKLLGGNACVTYAPGYYIPEKGEQSDINWQADSTKQTEQGEEKLTGQSGAEQQESSAESEAARKSREYRKEALRLAKECDTVIFVGGLNHDYDSEGLDRKDMKLPYEQDELISSLLAVRPDTVIVLYAGSPVEMPWLSAAKTLVWSYYAGMEGGSAIADVLYGKVNPSGKLAETFITDADQCPAHTIGTFGREDRVDYTEGVMVGYRYYDTENTAVNFCFGHGLSYTQYAYENLTVVREADGVKVTVDVTNTGSMSGKETVQIYVAPKQNGKVARPAHELKAFAKVQLNPGETKQVELQLGKEAFSYYDIEQKDFIAESGVYEIQAAASSRDIRLTAEVECAF